ncbi:MAG: hypothetical protein LBE91_13040 [Tannerella sp.]|jgi:hypothetical protein|nr:hypothetical protein [Tannerella sp.]
MNDKDLDKLISAALEDEINIPEGLSERLENKLSVYQSAVAPVKKSGKFFIITGIAATVLFCVGLFFALNFRSQYSSEKFADTFQDPVEAEMYAEKVLLMVSENLNKGLDSFEKAKENIDNTNKVLNNNLTIK